MTTPLTDEELRRYTALIDGILSTADLETVTRKKVRKGLEKALGGKDLSDQKIAIKDLIEARFDAINSQSQSSGAIPTPPLQSDAHAHERTESPHSPAHANGHGGADSDGDGDARAREDGDDAPAKKKHKRSSSSTEDADARLAAELQAQENRLARARTTRGGGTAKAAKPRKQAAKKKSASRVKDDDASDVDSEASGAGKEKRKAGGGFQKPFTLSYPLGELLGVTQVVKKLWEHIKGNELQDPTDKRQIRCDDKMQAVFKQHKIDMFQMNKLLSNHLFPVDEE